ncbi:lachesin-like [Amphibalanus amphitrite]|uniref:lachesin-like n=1 Tax=Amphibalanus amphitrite TaxID=1232801 RepID=UPI001C916463|nr:lachesin-like [Amphibalanus amphitrite]
MSLVPVVQRRRGRALTALPLLLSLPLLLLSLLLAAGRATGFSPSGLARLGVDPPVAPAGGRPWFDRPQIRNVTALLGRTAYLSCTVRALGNRTVSWVRHRDIHLLTVGEFTFTNDQRFRALHSPASRLWTLQIKFVQHRDAGMYACQVSSSPPVSYPVYLSVVEPVTDLLGGPELFIDARSTINLTCLVRNSPQPPAFIFWKHNGKVITYDSPRGGVSVVTIQGEVTSSQLLIRAARATDSGLYSCQPAGAAQKSLRVHVLQGEKPAAMQTGGGGALRPAAPLLTLLTLLMLLMLLKLPLHTALGTAAVGGAAPRLD